MPLTKVEDSLRSCQAFCSHCSTWCGRGKVHCNKVDKFVEEHADSFFGDGPEEAGLVKGEYHYLMGLGLVAQSDIPADTIIGAARWEVHCSGVIGDLFIRMILTLCSGSMPNNGLHNALLTFHEAFQGAYACMTPCLQMLRKVHSQELFHEHRTAAWYGLPVCC